MKVLFIGDIVGRPGREAIKSLVPQLRDELQIDFIIANTENIAGGSGVTRRLVNQMFEAGADVLTTGDHIWRKREVLEWIESEQRLLRPLNLKPNIPGNGWGCFVKDDKKIVVVNLIGRIFMEAYECPFVTIQKQLEELKQNAEVVIVDFHAEATSEKVAMGWFLDGKVTAVLGTHTHIPTADEKILPLGTAYITDVGMTGPFDSVIGRVKERVLERFVTGLPARFDVASGDIRLQAVLIDIDDNSKKAVSIDRIERPLKSTDKG